jgi:hypothetical protein
MWDFKENVASAGSPEETKGLWNVYENERGESTLRIHTPRTVWESCPKDEHYFEITNSPKREATCNKCGYITTFVVGMDFLKDGKFSRRNNFSTDA